MKHLAYRRLEKGHTAGVPRTVPGIGAVLSIVGEGTEKRRCQRVEVAFGFTNNMPGHKVGSVFVHMNKAVQLPQNGIGNMTGSAGFTVKVNRDIRITVANLLHKAAQLLQHRMGFFPAAGQLFIVDGQHKPRSPALLLGKGGKITIAGIAHHVHASFFNG